MKFEKFDTIFYILVGLLLVIAGSAHGQTSSGGAYTMTKTVVAGGGSDLQQNQMKAGNTAGQAVAGRTSTGGQFSLYSGFWTPDSFTPTAGTAVVSGQIRAADGRGIRNVIVTIIYPSGQAQTVQSTTFGYYRFAEIPIGGTYVISVTAKRYTFSQPSQIHTILDDAQDIDFTADASL